MTKQTATDAKVPTTYISVKAPIELFERLDRWCEQYKEREKITIKPSRPAAIRWIVHQFLLKQEERTTAASKQKRVKPARKAGVASAGAKEKASKALRVPK